MKKLLLSLFVIFTFSFYAIYQRPSNQPAASTNKSPTAVNLDNQTNSTLTNVTNIIPQIIKKISEDDGEDDIGTITPRTSPTPPATVPNTTPTPVTVPKTVTTPPPAPKTVTAPKGQYKDGEYTGNPSRSHGYNLQVKAVVQGGKLANVVFLSYAQGSLDSQDINAQAVPYLIQQAIQAQSANVNGVSGASQTSTAFSSSLGSALAMAAN